MQPGKLLEEARERDATWRAERATQRKARKERCLAFFEWSKELLMASILVFAGGWILWELGVQIWRYFPDFCRDTLLMWNSWSWPWKVLVGLGLLGLTAWGLEARARDWYESDDGLPH